MTEYGEVDRKPENTDDEKRNCCWLKDKRYTDCKTETRLVTACFNKACLLYKN